MKRFNTKKFLANKLEIAALFEDELSFNRPFLEGVCLKLAKEFCHRLMRQSSELPEIENYTLDAINQRADIIFDDDNDILKRFINESTDYRMVSDSLFNLKIFRKLQYDMADPEYRLTKEDLEALQRRINK